MSVFQCNIDVCSDENCVSDSVGDLCSRVVDGRVGLVGQMVDGVEG